MKRTNKRRPRGFARAYRDGSGYRFEAEWRDETGKPVLIDGKAIRAKGRGSTEDQAKRKAYNNLDKKKKALVATSIPKEHLLFSDFCQYWLDNHVIEYKTRVGYQRAIDGHIRPYLSSVSITKLETRHVLDLYKRARDKGLSRSIEIQIRAVGMQACELAVQLGYISNNPFKGLKLRKAVRHQVEHFSLEEVRAIMDVAVQSGREAYALIALTYGLRAGEHLALRWSDVDLYAERPILRVHEQIQRQTKKGLVRKQLKTAKSRRVIDIEPELQEALERLARAQEIERLVKGQEWNPEGYLFPTAKGTAKDPASDRRFWARLLVDAGVTFRRRHIARHTCAYILSNPAMAHELLGHSNMQVTVDFYGHMRRDTYKRELSQAVRTVFPSSGRTDIA